MIDQIHFTDDELEEIESVADVEINKIAITRNKELDNLHRERKRILKDMDYLKKNKISLLREGAMEPDEIVKEFRATEEQLKEVEARQQAYNESERDMLDYVITFSELVKEASTIYKVANDEEKRRLTFLIFSELTIVDGKLEKYVAKDPFASLLSRRTDIVYSGAPGGI